MDFFEAHTGKPEKLIGCKRILVIGSPGSGKTEYSKKLSFYTGLPYYSMDDLYWLKGWVRPKMEEFLSSLATVVESENWIIDGNYESSLETRLQRADAVILLDVPPCICLFSVVVRGLRRWMGDHSTLPVQIRNNQIHMPMRLIDPAFLVLVATFRSRVRPRMACILCQAMPATQLIVFRKRIDAYRALEIFG